MQIKVKLNDVVDALLLQDYESASYLEKSTGEIWTISADILPTIENDEEKNCLSDFEKKYLEGIKKITQFPDNFIELPSVFDIHEYKIMENFCYSIENDTIRNKALRAIQGKGAFRRFKNLMHYHNLIEQWYKYHENALKQQAIEWCVINNIDYEDIHSK